MGTEVIKIGLLGQSLPRRALDDGRSVQSLLLLFPGGGVSACWRYHTLPHPRSRLGRRLPCGWTDGRGGQERRWGGAADICSPCTTPALPLSSSLEEVLGPVVARAIIWYGDRDPLKARGSMG